MGVSSRRWVTALYLLKSVLYFLQYDNILSVDVSAVVDAASDFSTSSSTLSYKWFAIGHYCLSYAGRGNKEDNDSADMASLFRELLLGLRLTFLIEDNVVKYRKVNYGSAAIGDDSNYDYRAERREAAEILRRSIGRDFLRGSITGMTGHPPRAKRCPRAISAAPTR